MSGMPKLHPHLLRKSWMKLRSSGPKMH
jgi:hypothetical protein